MIQRCTNKTRTSWKYYGAKGITVCTRWMVFSNFLADMGERPKGLTLERKDSTKGYTPDNCEWADKTTQARNTSQSTPICIHGVVKTLPYWCEHLGISINTVRSRMKKQKWGIEQALLTPKQSTPFKKE